MRYYISLKKYIHALPDRLLTALEGLDDSLAGYQISRLTHSLQTATRAEADGADIELIVAALVHDLGDDLALKITHSLPLPSSAPMCVRKLPDPRDAWCLSNEILCR